MTLIDVRVKFWQPRPRKVFLQKAKETAAVFAAGLAAGYPRATDAAAANKMISGAPPSPDTADLYGFGLNCRHLIAA
jgi:hypothetical protein